MEGAQANPRSVENENVKVVVPAPARPWEYQKLQDNNTVDAVLEEVRRTGSEIRYRVSFEDGREEEVSVMFLPFWCLALVIWYLFRDSFLSLLHRDYAFCSRMSDQARSRYITLLCFYKILDSNFFFFCGAI
jgi:hypothetical protein